MISAKAFDVAGARFVQFFEELGGVFAEREEVLKQVALALLSREHVLMTGPPGTAKSGVAAAILRRIVDERSGSPSVYARQFTESTVQTDLVGPINFKTLMESGRTEHFTDEGMLGSVHAFLDEVFDGRDMLLRSTLNVLHERELKQGGQTTRGQIECALMTTNRYLAEVLEGSRETLLAFVDRIAFVSFVPRSFASSKTLANVLKRQVGTTDPLGAVLTIQDLDTLQAAVDDVHVPPEVLDVLAQFIGHMSEELAAAERADPEFIPTRYFSTRTAVRLGRLLRAVTVYDRLFAPNPKAPRALDATLSDIAGLRASLVLGGPLPETLQALLGKETDARERRQLSIIRTEREIFDRCLAKLPKAITTTARAVLEPKKPVAAAAPSASAEQPDEPQALAEPSLDALLDTTRSLAQESAHGGGRPGVADPLSVALAELHLRAVRVGLTEWSSERDTDAAVRELCDLANKLEASSTQARPTARWLRGRALAMLQERVRLHASHIGSSLADIADEPQPAALRTWVTARLTALEEIHTLRQDIRARGAEEHDVKAGDELWRHTCERSEVAMARALDLALQNELISALRGSSESALASVVEALHEPLRSLDQYALRLRALGNEPVRLKSLVIGPRLKPLITAAFARESSPDRPRLLRLVDDVLSLLRQSDLRDVLSAEDLLTLVGEALIRIAQATPNAEPSLDMDGYRELRKRDQHHAAAYTVLEVALRVATARADVSSPQASAEHWVAAARQLSTEMREALVDLDVARLDRLIGFLERWTRSAEDGASEPRARLQAYARAGILRALVDERALLRTSLEAKLVAEVFPSAQARTDKLRERIAALEEWSNARVLGLLRELAEAEWSKLLAQP